MLYLWLAVIFCIIALCAIFALYRYRSKVKIKKTLPGFLSTKNIFYQLINSSTDVIAISDMDRQIIFINSHGRNLLGLKSNGPLPQLHIRDVHPEKVMQYLEGTVFPILMKKGIWRGELAFKHFKTGEEISVDAVGMCFQDILKKNTYLATISRDIRVFKKAQADLEMQAKYETLTHLPNRFYFNEIFNFILKQSKRHRRLVSLLLIDLDKFKNINDTYGHHAGDLVLVESARRIKCALRDEDFVSRIGGDEFAAIIQNSGSTESIKIVVKKIISEIQKPFILNGSKINIDVSIGIAFYPLHGDKENEILEYADVAMYEAKKYHGSYYCFASQVLQKNRVKWISIETELKNSIVKNEFSLVYQPIYYLHSRKIYGFEILLRWDNAKLGLVSPNQFIPIAESIGIMRYINNWVIHTACKSIAKLINHDSPFIFFINLSMNHLDQYYILETVSQAIYNTNIQPKSIQFEVSGISLLKENSRQTSALNKIYQLGVSYALDDFGLSNIDFSNFKYLPVSTIKISKKFIQQIQSTEIDNKMIEVFISLAKKLNINVIAEGIESKEQVDFLLSRNCFIGQGFYFSSPVSFQRVAQMIRDDSQPHIDKNID